MLVSVMSAAIARRSHDTGREHALLLIEFDGLDRISNTLGHRPAGIFLKLQANRLIELTRPMLGDVSPEPIVAYLGGATFAVFVEGDVDPFSAVEAAGRMVEHLERPCAVDGNRVVSPVNAGIVVSGIGHAGAEEILRDAGTALGHARKQGRGACVVFDMPMHLQAVRRLKLEMEMREAIERKQFELFYQPIVDLPTGRLKAFEALMRWRHPEHGMVMPGEFIPVAEDTGMILQLGEFAAREAISQLARWQETFQAARNLQMNVNLSPTQLGFPGLFEMLAAELARTNVAPGAICLEVTESTLMQDKAAAAHTLRELRGMGVKIAMDDFGTGHSSLAYLHEFPIDMLKLDRTFVKRMCQDASGEAVVKAILQIARSFGLPMTAEGVETTREAFALVQMGCEFGQGYCFGRPAPAQQAERLLGAANDCGGVQGSSKAAIAAGI
jgi:EAL domain-containing protein (putative c-di-GMP-specific phosphodiesterase class I)/GGDEF domain-containing protein